MLRVALERALWLVFVLAMAWWLLDLYAMASGAVVVRLVVAVVVIFLMILALERGLHFHS